MTSAAKARFEPCLTAATITGAASLDSGRDKSGQQEHHEFLDVRAGWRWPPLAWITLPLPLQHRSIVIQMRRADGEREIRRLDDTSEAALQALGSHLGRWATDGHARKKPRDAT